MQIHSQSSAASTENSFTSADDQGTVPWREGLGWANYSPGAIRGHLKFQSVQPIVKILHHQNIAAFHHSFIVLRVILDKVNTKGASKTHVLFEHFVHFELTFMIRYIPSYKNNTPSICCCISTPVIFFKFLVAHQSKRSSAPGLENHNSWYNGGNQRTRRKKSTRSESSMNGVSQELCVFRSTS